MSNNGKELRKAFAKDNITPISKPNPYKQDVIYDPEGQWKYPGQVTRIPGEHITMKGVDYPVLGVDDKGNEQMMYPGMNYIFPGADNVTEYPQLKHGGSKRFSRVHDWRSNGDQARIQEVRGFQQGGWLDNHNPIKQIPLEDKMKMMSQQEDKSTTLPFGINAEGYNDPNYMYAGQKYLDHGISLSKGNFDASIGNFMGYKKDDGKFNPYIELNFNKGNNSYGLEAWDGYLGAKFTKTFASGGPSPEKAKEMLRDGSVYGHPLSDKQIEYFSRIAGIETNEDGQPSPDSLEEDKFGGQAGEEPKTVHNDALRTWNLGNYEGHEENHQMNNLIEDHIKNPDKPVPGGESYREFMQRTIPAIEKTKAQLDPDKSLFVTHKEVLRLYKAWLAQGKPDINKMDTNKVITQKVAPAEVETLDGYKFVRHGDTFQNKGVEGPDLVRTKDAKLAPKGIEEAIKNGEKISKDKNINLVVSSTLPRAIETAEIIKGKLKEFKRGGISRTTKLKSQKGKTSKNIKSSVNQLLLRNYTLFGPSGHNIYDPNSKKYGGWLDHSE